MQPPPSSPPLRQRAARILAGLLIAFFFWAIWQSALLLPAVGTDNVLVDFDAFYITGQLAWEGRAAEAHDTAVMAAIQHDLVGHQGFMPWTYPPQFGLFTEALSLLPVGLGYALFTGLTLALLVWSLFRLAPATAIPALMLTLPATLMTIRAGQNGFLTAALFALTFLLTLSRCPGPAGITLGLLAYKPHLGLGLGLAALLRGGAVMVLAAALTVAATLGLATWVFGPAIWSAFLQGVAESGLFLREGAYPMERMTSLYALLATLGLPSGLALAAQAAFALALLALIAFAALRRWRMEHLLALSATAGLGLSPYGYDYDLVALAPGLALALPALSAHTHGPARALLIAALLLATGWGLVTVLLSGPLGLGSLPALGALGYLVALALILRALFAAETRKPA